MCKGISKLLITGGAGFIGHFFVKESIKNGYSVVVVDKLTYAGSLKRLQGLEGSYKFYKKDICEQAAANTIFKKEKPDAVVNFAAETHVDRSIKNSVEFVKTNVEGTRVLLDAARKFKVKRFIQISSDETYGDKKRGASREGDNLLPNSPYAASKAAADLICRSYFKTYNLAVIIARSSNNFGPYQYPEKMIPLFLTNAIENKPLPLYGDGKNIRDWIYVEDNCLGIARLLKKGKPGEIYNIGGKNPIKNLNIAKQIIKILNKDENLLSFVKDRPAHDKRYKLDSTKIKKLGWRPKWNFKQAIELTVDWYLKNKSWWQPLKRKAKIIKW